MRIFKFSTIKIAFPSVVTGKTFFRWILINERGKGKIKQELYRTPRIYLNALLILC